MKDDDTRESREMRRVASEQLEDWEVLVIDDQLDNLLVAEAALKFHGATTYRARNGLEGLKVLETLRPTLILLDLSMPEMSGWEMFEKIKVKPELRDIPVIALTAHVMAGDQERVMAAGFTGYIPKPFSVSTLIGQIQRILETAKK